MGNSFPLYILVAILFGIGYGASYPILVAMAAADANAKLVPQTLQLFALTYFIGLFGFPLLAGFIITTWGSLTVLILTALMAITEASLALRRATQR
jgi:MFS family permease